MIRDAKTGWTEASIIINGVELTFPEAMAVRVAVSSFVMFVSEPSNRDAIGHSLADGYSSHLASVEQLMRRRTP